MQQLSPRKSWIVKAIFFGVYFLFFAVQLHLRYAFSSCRAVSTATSITTQAGHQSNTKGPGISQEKQTFPQAKLNKRFYPQPHHEPLPQQFNLQEELIVIQKQALTVTPSLHGAVPITRFLRGPPANC